MTAGISVSAGETIYVGLGSNGADSPGNTGGASAFGIGSGGNGRTSNANGGGGGGASAIAVDADIVMIAGGGGGAGSAYYMGFGAPYSGNGGTAVTTPNSSYGGGDGADGIGESETGIGGGLGGRSTNSTPASDLSRPSSGGGGGNSTQGFNAGGGGGGAGYFGGLGGGGGGGDIDKAGASGGGGGSSYTSSARIPGTNYLTYGVGPATPSASISYIDIQTSSLPVANVGGDYSTSLSATFAASDPPDEWTVSPALPAGISLNPNTGALSGTATTPSTGTYTFTATKFENTSYVAARSSTALTLTVSPVAPGSVFVSFDYNGATGSNTVTSAVVATGSSADVALPHPTKTGLEFTGWFNAQSLIDGRRITTVEAGDSGTLLVGYLPPELAQTLGLTTPTP